MVTMAGPPLLVQKKESGWVPPSPSVEQVPFRSNSALPFVRTAVAGEGSVSMHGTGGLFTSVTILRLSKTMVAGAQPACEQTPSPRRTVGGAVAPKSTDPVRSQNWP